MNEFELIQTIAVSNEAITAQYQFWMATTFAVVIAAHTAGEKISKLVRIFLATLYLAACAVFYFRYSVAVEKIQDILVLLTEIESFYAEDQQIILITVLRHFVFLGGTVLGIILIIKPGFGVKKSEHGKS